MSRESKLTVALFYCRHTPESTELDRQSLEEKYGRTIRLFPLPCSSRIEPIHLLRVLEELADAAYVICCPAGECRYSDGNLRARKRVQRARETIASLGLQSDRIGIVMNSKGTPKSLTGLVDEVMGALAQLKPSPVLNLQG